MINSSFKFIAKNPASILILGGILMLIIAYSGSFVTNGNSEQMFDFGAALIGVGVLVHMLWLVPRIKRGLK